VGGSLSLEWRYNVDQNREFLRFECGRINRSLSSESGPENQLDVFLAFVGQDIQITQPSYAQIAGS